MKTTRRRFFTLAAGAAAACVVPFVPHRASVSGNIKGGHYKQLIIDDPYSDAESPTFDNVWKAIQHFEQQNIKYGAGQMTVTPNVSEAIRQIYGT